MTLPGHVSVPACTTQSTVSSSSCIGARTVCGGCVVTSLMDHGLMDAHFIDNTNLVVGWWLDVHLRHPNHHQLRCFCVMCNVFLCVHLTIFSIDYTFNASNG